MTEPTRAVIVDHVVTNTVILSADVLKQWRDAGRLEDVFGAGARIVDVTGLDPQPAIGWGYDGQSFLPPERDDTGAEP